MGFFEWLAVLVIIALLGLIVYAHIKMIVDRKKREEEKERRAAARVWREIQIAFGAKGKVLTIRRYGRSADTKNADGWPFSAMLKWGSCTDLHIRDVELRILPDPIPRVQAQSRMDDAHGLSAPKKFYFPDDMGELLDHLTGSDRKK